MIKVLMMLLRAFIMRLEAIDGGAARVGSVIDTMDWVLPPPSSAEDGFSQRFVCLGVPFSITANEADEGDGVTPVFPVLYCACTTTDGDIRRWITSAIRL